MMTQEDNGEYISNSSIDNPPFKDRYREAEAEDVVPEKEPEQGQLFDLEAAKAETKAVATEERIFEVDFSITLKAEGSKPIKVPLLVRGGVRGPTIWKVMELALESRRNRNIIDAILDNPPPKVETGDEAVGTRNPLVEEAATVDRESEEKFGLQEVF